MSHDEIVAQGLLFFLAGYETTASAISFLSYSLATNPGVQDKLRQEITTLMHEKVSKPDNSATTLGFIISHFASHYKV